MNRSIFTAVVLSLVLGACASTGGKQTIFTEKEPRLAGYSASVAAPNPTAPNVFITSDKQIIVDQEPIRPPGNMEGDPVNIFFGLQEGGDWVFPDNGIEIRQHPNFCRTNTPYLVHCAYRRPAPGTVYKYTIRVKPKDGGAPLRDLDPSIMN